MRLLLLAAVSAAIGSPPGQDSVTGTASGGFGHSYTVFTFDARSGPSGENPAGTVTLETLFGRIGPLEVGCLGVSGSRATIVVKAPPNTSSVAGVQIAVVDGGPGGQDKLEWHILSALPPDCPAPSSVFEPVANGDLVVVDAPALPTSKEQCKHGGWRVYGFRNQGACVSFVNAASRPAR